MERTFVIIKPDAVKRGFIGEIIRRFERRGIKISRMKMKLLEKKHLDIHYDHVKKYDIYDEMIEFLMSGPSVMMILEGENVIKMVRSMIGEKFCYDSPPGSIRGDLGTGTLRYQNIIHASDSPETAETEIERFFG
jgi:nucleoside-diphosphate kinase